MNRSYVRTSSLARKFFEDFPDADQVPLDLLPPQQQAAFKQHVLPLLQLGDTTTEACCQAVQQLLPVFGSPGGLEAYSAARAAADYVQSPLALCILDTAAAFSLLPGASALAASDPPAFQELLLEDLRRRAVANRLDSTAAAAAAAAAPAAASAGAGSGGGSGGGSGLITGGSVEVVLDQHAAVKAAAPCPGDPDRLLLPDSALFRCCQSDGGSSAGSAGSAGSSGSNGPGYYLPFRHITDAARRALTTASSSSNSSAGGSSGSSGGSSASLLKRAVWRQVLRRECSHYLEPILGKEAAGAVLLVGSRIASIVKGYHSSSSSSMFQIAFAGYADAAAAQASLEGCLTEVLTRYFARHPTPVTNTAGTPQHPLAVATAHHLLLLLPEPTTTQLPTAVGLDHAALVAAAAAGAGVGPAAAAAAAVAAGDAAADPAAVAAAAAGLQPPPPPAPPAAAAPAAAGAAQGFRDVALCFDLALHPSTEALLLSAPNQLAAFAYDGDNIYTLPSAVRALASGALLLDPSAVARGASWCGDAAAALKGEVTAAAVPAAAECGATKLLSSGVLGPDRVAAAVQEVRAAAAAGWQPLLLLPLLLPAAGSSGALLPQPGSLWQQLLQADVGSILEPLHDSKGIAALLSSSSSSSGAGKKQQTWGDMDFLSLAASQPASAVAGGASSSSDGASPAALLQQPQLLRSLLTGAAVTGDPAAASAAGCIKGWAWDTIKLQKQQQQQQQGCQQLPGHLREVVQSRWWAGPVMRGSLLEGGVGVEQQQ